MRSEFSQKKKNMKDENEMDLDGMLNAEDVDNRMSRDKIVRILRDSIMKENKSIRDALGIADVEGDMVNRDLLKDSIKRITGSEASYDDIMKAMDYFN